LSARQWAKPRSPSSTSPLPATPQPSPTHSPPEHLQLIGADVEALAAQIRCAGCLFVGLDSATAFR